MKAHKLATTLPPDHRLSVELPDDFPAGPVEVIVLAASNPAKNIVKLGGVLGKGELPPGDPIADALQDLREERARRWSNPGKDW